MDRRAFLLRAGLLVVAIPAGELLAACGSTGTGSDGGTPGRQDGGADGGVDGGGDGGSAPSQTYTSSVVHGHSHDVTILIADYDSPPAAGITETTTVAAGHTHQVTLSEADLKAIHAGQSVTRDTTVTLGHKHTFTFVQS